MPDPLGGLAFTWPYFAVFAAAYLVGSIPFGLVLTRLAGLGDIRRIGSGNIGATNVLRTGRKGLAAATLVLDALKGAVPVVLADHLLLRDQAIVAGAGALLGHILPIWLLGSSRHGALFAVREILLLGVGLGLALLGRGAAGFAGAAMLAAAAFFGWGGKAGATGLGVLFAVSPAAGAMACAVWLIIGLIFRYSSLATIAACAAAPVAAFALADVEVGSVFLSDPQRAEFVLFGAAVILIRHTGNIRRLLAGEEPKFTLGRKTASR